MTLISLRTLQAAVAVVLFTIGAAAGATVPDVVRPPAQLTCTADVAPPPPGYPDYNPGALSQRLVFPATGGSCPDVPVGWNPYEGRTTCTWRQDMQMWVC